MSEERAPYVVQPGDVSKLPEGKVVLSPEMLCGCAVELARHLGARDWLTLYCLVSGVQPEGIPELIREAGDVAFGAGFGSEGWCAEHGEETDGAT